MGQITNGLVNLYQLSYLCLEFIPLPQPYFPPYSCIAFKAHLKYLGLCEAMPKVSHLVSVLRIVSPLQTGTPFIHLFVPCRT